MTPQGEKMLYCSFKAFQEIKAKSFLFIFLSGRKSKRVREFVWKIFMYFSSCKSPVSVLVRQGKPVHQYPIIYSLMFSYDIPSLG